MIVCSCNVFTDHDVRSTLSSGENVPRTTGQVYHCLGCSAQCGRCARTMAALDRALARGQRFAGLLDDLCRIPARICRLRPRRRRDSSEDTAAAA